MTATAGDATVEGPTAGAETEPTATAPSVAVWFGIGLLAVAHLGLLAVPGGLEPPVLAAIEIALLAVVAGVEYRFGDRSIRAVAVLVLGTAILLAGTWLAIDGSGLAVAAVGLAAVVTLAAYFLHRYELVVLGLLEVPDERE